MREKREDDKGVKRKRDRLRDQIFHGKREEEEMEEKIVVFNLCAFVSVRLTFINGCGYTMNDLHPLT